MNQKTYVIRIHVQAASASAADAIRKAKKTSPTDVVIEHDDKDSPVGFH